MKKQLQGFALGTAVLGSLLETANGAGFIEDSKATLDLRNFYYNSDTRDTHKATVDEWGQAFVLNVKSGFTTGTIGLGLDVIGTYAVKLDSSGPGALFPRKRNGQAVDDFSRGGLTGKLQFAKTEARVGTLLPSLPVISANDGRLMPQLFEGAMVTSKDIDNLSLTAGQIEHATGRMSSDTTGLAVAGGTRQSNKFRFVGGNYTPFDNVLLQYYFANLEDYYNQNFLGAMHSLKFDSGQSLKTDLRWFRTRGNGANAMGAPGYRTSGFTKNGDGEIDNNTWSSMFTYGMGGHAFSLGYQEVSDNSNFVQLNQGSLVDKDAGGTSLYLITDRMTASFNYAGERTVLGQYGYDFASLGMPGLTANLAYLKGDQIKQIRGAEEWERDFIVGYVVQSGGFKGVGVTWRNSSLRSDIGGDVDQNRMTVSYSLALW